MARPSSTLRSVGFGSTEEKTTAPGASLATRSKTGVRARPASVTSSGREIPRLLNSSGRRSTAPAPNKMVVGKLKVETVTITMKTHSGKIAQQTESRTKVRRGLKPALQGG